ncbi:hypothetical protein niasHT_009521 [Heterodera trifolii]|uniref:Phosphatidylinositol transfer protein N-terminal domain-containing protein n=1 Tax=Heterodera trifolii TaxID=157864 RepID=A0ABD2M411_9BILA
MRATISPSSVSYNIQFVRFSSSNSDWLLKRCPIGETAAAVQRKPKNSADNLNKCHCSHQQQRKAKAKKIRLIISRIVMPLTIEEYQIGQLFSVNETSRQETGGGEGVQVVRNEPFEGESLFNGRFTSGHLRTRFTIWNPKCRLSEHELSWNAFPYCKTELTNPDYMKDDFLIRFETMHLSDRGTTKNALGLSKRVLNERKVVCIDIANDKISENVPHAKTATRKRPRENVLAPSFADVLWAPPQSVQVSPREQLVQYSLSPLPTSTASSVGGRNRLGATFSNSALERTKPNSYYYVKGLCHHPALSDFICGVNESIDRQVDAARSARHFIHKRHKRYILKDAVIMRILADASYNSNGEISDLMSALGLQVEGYAGKLRDFENYDYSIVHVPY